MLRQQIANLFYEILVDFPRELTQLLADYVDILPINYTLVSKILPGDHNFTDFEVIQNKGLVIYGGLGPGYQKTDFKTQHTERVNHKIDDILQTYCRINKKGDDFIIRHRRNFYSFNGDLSNQQIDEKGCHFVVDPLSDTVYTYSHEGGVWAYSTTNDMPSKQIMTGDIGFIGKIREGFIVQKYETGDFEFELICHNYKYDNDMKNPVKINVGWHGFVHTIVETKKHLYIIDDYNNIFINGKKYTDLPDNIEVFGIYRDHIIGQIYDLSNHSSKLVICNNTQDYQILYVSSSQIRDIRCFDNEIYVLTSSLVFKLTEAIVS